MVAVQVPGYERFEQIGRGGFSEVYKAYQPEFQRAVAIKVLNLDELSSLDGDALRRECQAIGAVSNHPNIVTVYGSGVTTDGRPFIAMELCRDESLHGMLRRRQVVSVRRALTIGASVADALALAHDKNILHRDIKPQNILFSDVTGLPALADFGIAYQTTDGTQHQPQGLTVQYAAPEVIDEQTPTIQADIYSLGATLYTTLAGRRPFHDESNQSVDELIERIIHSPVPPIARPGVPPVVEQLVVDMMAKDPARRPMSARDVGRRVRDIQRQLGMAITPSTLPDGGVADQTEKTLGRRRSPHQPPPAADARSGTWPPEGPTQVPDHAGNRPHHPLESKPAAPVGALHDPFGGVRDGQATAFDPTSVGLRSEGPGPANDRSPTSATVARPPRADRPPVQATRPDDRGQEGTAAEGTGRGRLLAAIAAAIAVVTALAVGVLISSGGGDDSPPTTELAAPSTTQVIDLTPPAPPTDVRFTTKADGAITVSWSEVEPAASYRVLFVNGGLEPIATESTSVDLAVDRLPTDGDLCVEILAVGPEGQAGDPSAVTCR